jgi:hypothetical protein
MTENDLTDLGFNKVEINDLESQNGYDYYYYTLEVFNNLTLSSVDSDRVEDGHWYVFNFDWPMQFRLDTKEDVNHFLETLKAHLHSQA